MDILRNIGAILFYILFFVMIIFIFINRLKCGRDYQKIKRSFYRRKIYQNLSRVTRIIATILSSIIGIYFFITIILHAIFFFMSIITVGGAAYVDTHGDSTFYNFLATSCSICLSGFKYVQFLMYALYIPVYLFLLKHIYVHYLSYQALKNK